MISSKVQGQARLKGDLISRPSLQAHLKNNYRLRATGTLTVHVDFVNGSDNNNGTSTALAFKTLQAAFNYVIANYDTRGNNVILQHASGQTITQNIFIANPWTGGGALTIDLGGSTLSITGADAITVSGGGYIGPFQFQNGTIQTTTSGNCITASSGADVFVGPGTNFGPCAGLHVIASGAGATIQFNSNYTISGGAQAHWFAQFGGVLIVNSAITITLTGTPNFSAEFAGATVVASMFLGNATVTFSGAATGNRFNAQNNAVIFTNGTAPPNYLPGNAAGSTGSGGIYA